MADDSFNGGSGLIGGALGSGLGFLAAKQQRQWQEKMYKRRYQYTMQDMRAAGLNPILAYQQGVGSAGTTSAAKIPDLAAGMASASQASSAKGLRASQGGLMDAQRNLTRQTAATEVHKTQREKADALAAGYNASAAELALSRKRAQSRMFDWANEGIPDADLEWSHIIDNLGGSSAKTLYDEWKWLIDPDKRKQTGTREADRGRPQNRSIKR